ncbi:hypothetical protein FACS1894172_09620 [Spirochaetia bacterium]|nr:hypothetical protein FACS1894172_09620 [Spirochaetia bacterium]
MEFVEKAAPPVAMTVLTFNALAAPSEGLSVQLFIGTAVTALIHVWKRNYLVSIFGGCAVFMALDRFVFR